MFSPSPPPRTRTSRAGGTATHTGGSVRRGRSSPYRTHVRCARSGASDRPTRRRGKAAISEDAEIARLILVNGAPASGKSTLARRYVDEHEGAALVEVDTLRMTLPNWEDDEATRLAARDLAGASVVEHLGAGCDVVMPQYFGRLGYIVLLDDVAREQHATFVEVVLEVDADLAVERFRARRQAMAERGERHPERDIADDDVEAFVHDAVERLMRLPTARPRTKVVPVERSASPDEVYRRLCSALA